MSHVLLRFPDCRMGDILDLGCLVGASTLAYAEQFPGARIEAVDTSAPALRFAHGMAEARGFAVHYLAAECRASRLSPTAASTWSSPTRCCTRPRGPP